MTNPGPVLHAPYATALARVIEHAHDTWRPTALVVAGTIMRGRPHATSDFDVVVIHEQPWRQRVQYLAQGVPVEYFVNPVFELERTLDREAESARPAMIHMLATGVIVHDPQGHAARLQRAAQAAWDAGPRMPDETLTTMGYHAACTFEDAVDIADDQPDRARILALTALEITAKTRCIRAGHWIPRTTDAFIVLEGLDPALREAIQAVLTSPDLRAALDNAAPIVNRVIGHTGFFEWIGQPQRLTP